MKIHPFQTWGTVSEVSTISSAMYSEYELIIECEMCRQSPVQTVNIYI